MARTSLIDLGLWERVWEWAMGARNTDHKNAIKCRSGLCYTFKCVFRYINTDNLAHTPNC